MLNVFDEVAQEERDSVFFFFFFRITQSAISASQEGLQCYDVCDEVF